MENGTETSPLSPLFRTPDNSHDRGHDEDDERARPSPLLQSTSAGEGDAFLQRVRSPSIPGQEHHGSDEAKKQLSKPPPSTTLHRSAYVLILVLLYMSIAILAWVVTCVLTFRPMTDDNNGYGWVSDISSLFIMNQNCYRAARVLQSIVNVLTIPLTSTVCSSAAVIFVQHNQKSFGLKHPTSHGFSG